MEMLFSLHIFSSPRNAAHARPIPILRYQLSQIDKSRILFHTPPLSHTCSSSSCCFLIAIVIFVFSAFILSVILSNPLCSSNPAGSLLCPPVGRCHQRNGGCLVV